MHVIIMNDDSSQLTSSLVLLYVSILDKLFGLLEMNILNPLRPKIKNGYQ